MTYRELLKKLNLLSEEQLDYDLTVLDIDKDEYYPAHFTITGDFADVLDENHPIITFKG